MHACSYPHVHALGQNPRRTLADPGNSQFDLTALRRNELLEPLFSTCGPDMRTAMSGSKELLQDLARRKRLLAITSKQKRESTIRSPKLLNPEDDDYVGHSAG